MKFTLVLTRAFSEWTAILTSFSTFLTIFALVGLSEYVQSLWWRIIIVLVIFIVSYLIAVIKVLFTNRKTLKIGNGKKLIVSFKDIFDGKDIVVIPVNEYFDTLVDYDIISSNSIHGKFINKYFKNKVNELDTKIHNSLQKQNIRYDTVERNVGKLKKYPLGSVAMVEESGKVYFLAALTRFNKNNKAECNQLEYYETVVKLLKFINEYGQGKSVTLPLLGGGLARLNAEKQVILENLISVIKLNDSPMVGELEVALNIPLKNEIDLSKL